MLGSGTLDLSPRAPSLLPSLIPVIFLIGMLASAYLFGDSSSGGASQIAPVLSAALAATIGMMNSFPGPRSKRKSSTGSRCRSGPP